MKPMTCSSVYLLYFMSVIFLVDELPGNYAGMAGRGRLDERSRDILTRRWLSDEKATLHELAAEYSVSAERIRQLEKNAMEKIKSAMLTA